MKKNETLSFKVSEEFKKELEALAKSESRSLSNFVQLVLAREIEKRKKK